MTNVAGLREVGLKLRAYAFLALWVGSHVEKAVVPTHFICDGSAPLANKGAVGTSLAIRLLQRRLLSKSGTNMGVSMGSQKHVFQVAGALRGQDGEKWVQRS